MRVGILVLLATPALFTLAPAPAPPESPFRTSETCRLCHSNAPRATAMRDAGGRPIAPFDLWRSSMMANAARDPFWRAAVSAEVAATPSRRTDIEAKCNRCHAPMARGPDEELGRDGVSCTVCHTITDASLGTADSFSGRFTTDQNRRAFGPHRDPFAHPMRMHTGLEPVAADHVTRSALCATCHTLLTHTLAADGTPTGAHYAEQTPYLEWRNSAFNDEVAQPGPLAASCQDCHAPTAGVDGAPLRTRIARNPGGRDWPPIGPRSPFGRHVFVGGNTLLPAILRDNAQRLEVAAPAAAFDATVAAARTQLRERTATLTVERAERSDDELVVSVRVDNAAGHKFPSAYPSRRAWLRLRVHDTEGALLFASGHFDDAGRIVGADGKPLPSERLGGPIEPHRNVIQSADEVQIYEVVMADADGAPTYRLLRAAANAKDNRLLPAGWQRTHADAAATAPVGTDDDADFTAGTDTVTWRIPLNARDRCRVEVDLLYQTLGRRYAAELLRWQTPEVRAFEVMLERADQRPELVASASATVR